MQLCFLSYKHEETNDCVLRKESLKLPLHSRVWIEGGKNLNKIKICTFDCFVLLRLVCSNEWLPEWQQIAGRQFLLDSVECKNPSASQVFSGLSWTAPILIWRDLDWSCGHRGSEHRTTMDRRADAEMLIGWTINPTDVTRWVIMQVWVEVSWLTLRLQMWNLPTCPCWAEQQQQEVRSLKGGLDWRKEG